MAFEVVLLLIGFASGYGIRALISRNRRAAARKLYLERKALAQSGKISIRGDRIAALAISAGASIHSSR
jgi:hypothetical protein